MEYQIELNESRNKPRQSTFLHLLTGFALAGTGAATILLGNSDWIRTVFHAAVIPSYIPGALGLSYGIIVLVLVFTKSAWLLQQRVTARFRIVHAVVCLIMAAIFLLSHWWLAAGIVGMIALANLFAYSHEKKQVLPVFVSFSEEMIRLPSSSRKKQLQWTEVERVLLRHGNITIDCTNNFLYQWTIRHNDTDAPVFEAFCRDMIESNREKRVAQDW